MDTVSQQGRQAKQLHDGLSSRQPEDGGSKVLGLGLQGAKVDVVPVIEVRPGKVASCTNALSSNYVVTTHVNIFPARLPTLTGGPLAD